MELTPRPSTPEVDVHLALPARAPALPPVSPLRSSFRDTSTQPRKSVSFDKSFVQVPEPPNPRGRDFYGKYATAQTTRAILREMWCGLTGVSSAYGQVSMWLGSGNQASLWCLLAPCLGRYLVIAQREQMEIKLHRWHRERGAARGEPNLDRTGNVVCLCGSCCLSYYVAEHKAVMLNFKLAQGVNDESATLLVAPPQQEMERAAVTQPLV